LIKSLSKKKVVKPLDIEPEIRDNRPSEVIDEPVVPEEIDEIDEIVEEVEVEAEIEDKVEDMSPEKIEEVKKEIEREINTQAVKGDGWLDDVNNTK